MQFQTLKMAAISRGQGRLRSNSQTRCPLLLAVSLPRFIWINQNRLGEVQKCDFFELKWPLLTSWNIEQLGPNFALHSGTTQDRCLQNIIRISAKLRVQGTGQRFDNTFWILLMRRRQQLQTNQTHIGPTLHVGPNYIVIRVHCFYIVRDQDP